MGQRRLSASERQVVLAKLRAGGTVSGVARELGLGETTVRRVRDNATNRASIDRFGNVAFRSAKKYYCDACRAWVLVRPCPVCVLRERGGA